MLRLSAFATLVLGLPLVIGPTVWAQTTPDVSQPTRLKPRKLAPGVLTTITPEPLAEETFTGPRPIVEIVNSSKFNDWTPNHWPKTSTIKDIASRIFGVAG